LLQRLRLTGQRKFKVVFDVLAASYISATGSRASDYAARIIEEDFSLADLEYKF
jgi:hypothetical protein